MVKPPSNKSTLFWVAILIFSVLDLLAAIGARTLIGILQLAAQFDWLSPWLVIAAGLNPTIAPAISLFNLIIVGSICFAAIYRISNTTEFLPAINSIPDILLNTGVLTILYVLFAITLSGPPAVFPKLNYEQGYWLYIGLLTFATVCLSVLPYMRSLPVHSNPTLPQFQGDIGSVLAAAFLFTGGLATLTSMEVGLAIVAIVVSASRLYSTHPTTQIELENQLIKTLQLLDRGPIGFAVVFTLLTGVVIASEWYTLVTSGVPFVHLAMVTGFPSTKLGIFTVGSFVIGSAVSLSFPVLFLQAHTSGNTLDRLALKLLLGLWLLLGCVFWWQSAIGPEMIPFAFGEPIVYASLLAAGVVVIGVVRERSTSNRLYYLSLGLLCASLGPIFVDQSIFSQTLFLDFAVLGYWGGPVFERIGLIAGKQIAATS